MKTLSSLLVILALMISCTNDNGLNTIKEEPPDAPIPSITVEALSESPVSAKFGCPVSESFLISSTGTDILEISDISLLISAQTDAEIEGSLPDMPLELAPEDSITITVSFDSFDDEDVKLLLEVESDDPDMPLASDSTTIMVESLDIITDTFTSTSGKNIDLLLVIDNSGSMSAEQARLQANAQYIIDGLDANSSDYHIGLITTDDPNFVGSMITSSDLDPVLELSTQIDVGIFGSSIEKGIQQAIDATSLGGDAGIGSSFLRENSTLAIVWISDEDDSSSGSLTDWASHFWGLKNSPSDIVGWSIVGIDTTCTTTVMGYDYIDLAQTLGGGITRICDENWQPTFEGLASTAGAQSTFDLSNTPLVSSIEVTVGGVVSYDWIYVSSTNSVSFNPGYIPVAGSLIEIKYGISEC